MNATFFLHEKNQIKTTELAPYEALVVLSKTNINATMALKFC